MECNKRKEAVMVAKWRNLKSSLYFELLEHLHDEEMKLKNVFCTLDATCPIVVGDSDLSSFFLLRLLLLLSPPTEDDREPRKKLVPAAIAGEDDDEAF